MGFRKEVLRRLEEVEAALGRKTSEVEILQDVISMLREENKDLKDRFMSRDFEQLQVYQAVEDEKEQYLGNDYGVGEGDAGEILDLAEVKG